MRAFIRGVHRYRTDKEYSKKVLAKYGKINDEEILEGTWQDYAPTLVKVPRPVGQRAPVYDREPVQGQEILAETGTVHRQLDRRSAGKKRLYRLSV